MRVEIVVVSHVCVIPAKAGIQIFQDFLDPGFHRGDGRGNLPPGFLDTLLEIQDSRTKTKPVEYFLRKTKRGDNRPAPRTRPFDALAS